MVAEGSPSLWLTAALVEPVDQVANAESGIICLGVVLIALPPATAEPPAEVPFVLDTGALAAPGEVTVALLVVVVDVCAALERPVPG